MGMKPIEKSIWLALRKVGKGRFRRDRVGRWPTTVWVEWALGRLGLAEWERAGWAG